MSSHPVPSPPPEVPPASGSVRRHHTISASSRISRTGSKVISEEDQQGWIEDEVVDLAWVGSLGAVGEKSSLHRQASLPTRYGINRGFGAQPPRQQGTLTPRTLNSLSAIAGHEGEEEDWERQMRDLRSDDDEQSLGSSEHLMDPSSPPFGATQVPSPPPASSSVRRHQSLTYPNVGGPRRMGALKRAGTLQAPPIKGHQSQGYPSGQSPSPTNADEDEDEGLEEPYYPQTQYPTSPMGRSSPWGTPGAGSNEWRTPGGNGNPGTAIDDVSRALNALELSQSYQSGGYQQQQHSQGQSVHPPRFNPAHPPPQQAQGMRRGSQSGSNTPGANDQVAGSSNRRLQLVTDFDGRTTTPIAQGVVGPVSASAYVPPIGHGPGQPVPNQQTGNGSTDRQQSGRDRALTASGASSWDQKERVLGGRGSNPNLHNFYQASQGGKNGNTIPSVPPIPVQYLNQGQAPRMGTSTNFGMSGVSAVPGQAQGSGAGNSVQMPLGMDIGISSPVDIPTLLATKGYNPVEFDIKPAFARYFVIKSYTEDDVHKSLKYEIWSSTDPGNKRLDKAFKETAGHGPIYLFFSVNASGHFCGMAEMLTPVDYTRSSTVWASDKWKGVFKVRWIYVRDIPNTNLRHIRLNNTSERKPVTNSRDTQELLPEAGLEMLRIFHTHPARTSLLQDFAFYELQSLQKVHVQQQSGASPPPVHMSLSAQHTGQQQNTNQGQGGQQHPFAMSNPNALAFAAQQMGMSGMGMNMGMNPMLQMQMNMNSPFSNPAAMQSVMRNPSPGPLPIGPQGFMGGQF